MQLSEVSVQIIPAEPLLHMLKASFVANNIGSALGLNLLLYIFSTTACCDMIGQTMCVPSPSCCICKATTLAFQSLQQSISFHLFRFKLQIFFTISISLQTVAFSCKAAGRQNRKIGCLAHERKKSRSIAKALQADLLVKKRGVRELIQLRPALPGFCGFRLPAVDLPSPT